MALNRLILLVLLLAVLPSGAPALANDRAVDLKKQAQSFVQAIENQPPYSLDELLIQTPGYPCLGTVGFIADLKQEFQCFLRTLEVVVQTQVVYDRPSEFGPLLERGLRRLQDALLDPWTFSDQTLASAASLFASRFAQNVGNKIRLASAGFTIRHGFGIFKRSGSSNDQQSAHLIYNYHSAEVLAQSLMLAKAVLFAGKPPAAKLPLPRDQYDISELLPPRMLSDLSHALLLKSNFEESTRARFWSGAANTPSPLLTARSLKALIHEGGAHYWSPEQASLTVQWLLNRQLKNGSWSYLVADGGVGEDILITAQITDALMAYESFRIENAAATLPSIRDSIDKAMTFILTRIGYNAALKGPVWDYMRTSSPAVRLALFDLQALPQKYLQWSGCESNLLMAATK